MPLELPNLDDRDFDALLESAKKRILDDLNTNWNDLTPGDPGVVLLEAFVYLTDQLLYRLNRLPDKAYVAFLQLLGVTLNPPTAAWVKLKVWHSSEANKAVTVPLGARISISGSVAGASEERQPPVFITTQKIRVPKESRDEASAVEVEAVHCEWVEEVLGASQGVLGQKFPVMQPPIVARMGNPFDLVVGIEVPEKESTPKDWRDAEKTRRFRIWREVDHFGGLLPDDEVYRADRQAGIIEFAPAARLRWQSGPDVAQTEPVHGLAAKPAPGRQIRVWYPRGGGEAGNVPARSLNTILPSPEHPELQGLSVVNPEAARGGLDAETQENALVRGPQQMYSLERAVTPRDFELLATRASRLLSRARANAARDLWKHAPLGMVDLVVVPALATARQGQMPSQRVTAGMLRKAQHDKALADVQAALLERSPLGISNRVRWARYKKISVKAVLTVGGNEKPSDIEKRLTDLLYDLINPLPEEVSPEIGSQSPKLQRIARSGWPFGQALRMAEVYRWMLSAQKDALVHELTIHLEHAPDKNVPTLAADFFQPDTWYAGSETGLFRSTNNADGWELVLDLKPESDILVHYENRQGDAFTWEARPPARSERTRLVRACPSRAGLVALATEFQDEKGQLRSPLYLSPDCGESWYSVLGSVDAEIEDMAWMQTGGGPALLLATDQGLRKVDVLYDRSGQFAHLPYDLIPVIAGQPKHPLYAVAAVSNRSGSQRIAVAAKSRQGVYASSGADLVPLTDGQSQPPGSRFTLLGLKQEDIRHLNVQMTGNRIFLWAGSMAPGDLGHGCMRWQLDDDLNLVDQGRWVSSDWTGGSCRALAFLGNQILAITAWGGVLSAVFDPSHPDILPAWVQMPQEDLPRRRTELEETRGRRGVFQPLTCIASRAEAGSAVILVGSEDGIHRSLDMGKSFSNAARRSFVHLRDAVTIPPDWLFVSDRHQIKVNLNAPAAAEQAGTAGGDNDEA